MMNSINIIFTFLIFLEFQNADAHIRILPKMDLYSIEGYQNKTVNYFIFAVILHNMKVLNFCKFWPYVCFWLFAI